MKDNNVAVHSIIKYDPGRNYFGLWSPKRLHTVYREIYNNPFRPLVFMETGKLSAEIICDTLWNEMSYNPLRFGEQNPFEINGASNIKAFVAKYKTGEGFDYVMQKVAAELDYFLYFIGKSNPEFPKFDEIYSSSVLIDVDRHGKSGYGYKALASLSESIHNIASQNIKDYKIKKYREQINSVVMARHPNLNRSNEPVRFVQIDRAKTQKDYLYNEIATKNSEIMNTNMRINTLNECEPPADTSRETALLARQNQDLQTLEELYASAKNKYDRLISPEIQR